jgi:plastocyanin
MRLASTLIPLFIVLASGATGAGLTGDDDPGKKVEPKRVVAKSLKFDPKKVEITEGESVVWVNKARTAHTATSDDGKTFDTKEFKPGETTKPVKFEKAGEFKYHCKVHGKTMSGTVVVKAKAKAKAK